MVKAPAGDAAFRPAGGQLQPNRRGRTRLS